MRSSFCIVDCACAGAPDRGSYVLSRGGVRLAGSPVMGHSGEGRLVSGHAVPVGVVMVGRQIARKTTGGVRALLGQSRHHVGAQRGSARKVSRAT